jgi:dCTP deaminase
MTNNQLHKDIKQGILPCQTIRELIKLGEIKANIPIEEAQIQPASLDLRLGEFAYPVDASFLSGKNFTVMEKMQKIDADFAKYKLDLKNGAVLEKGRVYVIPLLENVNLSKNITAFSNPKSSTGRLDILTRLIADYGAIFDCLPIGYNGNLYIEVAPKSFSIVAKTGTCLNQLRFKIGNSNIASEEWSELINQNQLSDALEQQKEELQMVRVSVDLQGHENQIIGYKAKKYSGRIDLEKRDYETNIFWEAIYANKSQSIILDPNEFYILMTKESLSVPPSYAAEMTAYDTRAGEFRVHYAGFFDPGFGYDLLTKKAGNSRAVLEVRSHEVPFLLEHGQVVGWLKYEKMAEIPTVIYGQNIKSNYQGQALKLAKQFL